MVGRKVVTAVEREATSEKETLEQIVASVAVEPEAVVEENMVVQFVVQGSGTEVVVIAAGNNEDPEGNDPV
jgi:hypothetical protein